MRDERQVRQHRVNYAELRKLDPGIAQVIGVFMLVVYGVFVPMRYLLPPVN